MEQRYAWTFTPPGQRLFVHMENRPKDCPESNGKGKTFDATLDLARGPSMTTGAVLWRQLRYPAMPALTLFWIYRQAAQLWLRGSRVYDHPQETRVTQETP